VSTGTIYYNLFTYYTIIIAKWVFLVNLLFLLCFCVGFLQHFLLYAYIVAFSAFLVNRKKRAKTALFG